MRYDWLSWWAQSRSLRRRSPHINCQLCRCCLQILLSWWLIWWYFFRACIWSYEMNLLNGLIALHLCLYCLLLLSYIRLSLYHSQTAVSFGIYDVSLIWRVRLTSKFVFTGAKMQYFTGIIEACYRSTISNRYAIECCSLTQLRRLGTKAELVWRRWHLFDIVSLTTVLTAANI